MAATAVMWVGGCAWVNNQQSLLQGFFFNEHAIARAGNPYEKVRAVKLYTIAVPSDPTPDLVASVAGNDVRARLYFKGTLEGGRLVSVDKWLKVEGRDDHYFSSAEGFISHKGVLAIAEGLESYAATHPEDQEASVIAASLWDLVSTGKVRREG